MNTIIKQVLAFILSFALIFSSTSALAASPSGWAVSPADIIIGGVNATVTAIKGAGASALQSTVKHAPNAAKLGTKLLKGAGAGAVLMAVTQILGKAVDYTLDPANNRVIYTELEYPPSAYQYKDYYGKIYSAATMMGVCNAIAANPPPSSPYFVRLFNSQYDGWVCEFSQKPNGLGGTFTYPVKFMGGTPKPVEKYIPIAQVSAKVIANSVAGDVPSQEVVKTVIIDDVNAGVLDVPLNTNAVPVADAPPVTPPYDPTQPVPPFDPSSIIAAIKSVMAAVVNMSGVLGAKIDTLMIDLGLKQAETIEAITAGTGEIVAANDRTGAKVAEMVAAIEAIEGNTLDGQVINDAVDRVIANDNVKVGDIVAAIEAIEGNTLDGQVINDAVDRVIANDNVNAQAAADAATAAADAAKAADAARAADAQAAKEAADAKAAADAEFQDWVKEEAPVLDNDTELDIPIPDLPMPDTDINFGGSCPANFEFNGSIFGNPINIVLLDTSKFCGFLSTFVKFPVYAASSLFALYILGGRKDV